MEGEGLSQGFSQNSQGYTISQDFPCGQNSGQNSGGTRLPRDDSEALSMYLTIAKNSPNSEAIIKTLSLVKHSVTYNQNLKNLMKAGQKELKKTLGFLLACDENDEEITKFKVEGLRIATMETLLRLMPIFCKTCKEEDPYVVFPVMCQG